MNTTVEEITQEDSPGKITLSKPELLEGLLQAFQDYRKENQFPHYKTFKIHLSTLNNKILFDSFVREKGSSTHPSWSNYWSRIKYTLSEYVTEEEGEFYITPDVETKIQAFIAGSNCTTDSSIQFDLQVNFKDYFEEAQITVYRTLIPILQLQVYSCMENLQIFSGYLSYSTAVKAYFS